MLDRILSMNGMTEIGKYQQEQQISCHPVYSTLSSAMYTYLKPGGLLYTWSNVNLRIDPGSQRLSVTFNLEKYLFASLSDMIFEKKRKERANRDIFDLQRFLFFGI